MASWTTCFVAALATAGAGALCLSLIASPRPHAVAERQSEAQARPENVAQGKTGQAADSIRVQRLSASSD